MTDEQADRRRSYACAVGEAVLALNSVESEIFYLLEILGAARGMEGVYITDKITRLKTVAQETNPPIRARMEKIVSETLRLADERNNFAHGLLWVDGFTGEHRRTYIERRRKKGKAIVKVTEDARPPEEIEHVAFDLMHLALDVRDLTMALGGLERWEKEAAQL